ncbi:MAG: NAD(P)H-hydrate dehydratase [Planctomycetes bacterium]|nr:NAD(P)H-hydrate dehydratase [Planctomycetota bacterium]
MSAIHPPFPFPPRERTVHKGSAGDVLVVAGSRGMSGAACLTAQACLRTGAGLATIACPEGINDILEVKTTCVMTKPLPQTSEGGFAEAALEPLLELTAGRDALAIGPGIGRGEETAELTRRLVLSFFKDLEPDQGPRLVLDADGLNAFEGQAEALQPLAGRAVLTPHPGEFQRLGGELESGDEGRERALRSFVDTHGVCTLLKGAGTLVCATSPEGLRLYRNETGNAGLATAGSGDVLTGMIAALLGQGLPPYEAACLGAWLHGRAGDLAARVHGMAPLVASDLLATLPEVIRGLEERWT